MSSNIGVVEMMPARGEYSQGTNEEDSLSDFEQWLDIGPECDDRTLDAREEQSQDTDVTGPPDLDSDSNANYSMITGNFFPPEEEPPKSDVAIAATQVMESFLEVNKQTDEEWQAMKLRADDWTLDAREDQAQSQDTDVEEDSMAGPPDLDSDSNTNYSMITGNFFPPEEEPPIAIAATQVMESFLEANKQTDEEWQVMKLRANSEKHHVGGQLIIYMISKCLIDQLTAQYIILFFLKYSEKIVEQFDSGIFWSQNFGSVCQLLLDGGEMSLFGDLYESLLFPYSYLKAISAQNARRLDDIWTMCIGTVLLYRWYVEEDGKFDIEPKMGNDKLLLVLESLKAATNEDVVMITKFRECSETIQSYDLSQINKGYSIMGYLNSFYCQRNEVISAKTKEKRLAAPSNQHMIVQVMRRMTSGRDLAFKTQLNCGAFYEKLGEGDVRIQCAFRLIFFQVTSTKLIIAPKVIKKRCNSSQATKQRVLKRKQPMETPRAHGLRQRTESNLNIINPKNDALAVPVVENCSQPLNINGQFFV